MGCCKVVADMILLPVVVIAKVTTTGVSNDGPHLYYYNRSVSALSLFLSLSLSLLLSLYSLVLLTSRLKQVSGITDRLPIHM